MAEGDLDVRTLRELFRNLQAWRAVYESNGLDEVTDNQGRTWSLWDIEHLYEQLPKLPPQQRRAIELCLIQNKLERDAAVLMGVSPTNPVAMYATLGMEKIIEMVNSGLLSRFHAREAS